MKRIILLASLVSVFALTGAVRAETKVELKGTHLCCQACVRAVNDIIKKVDGASNTCDAKSGTVTITAKDDATAKKALLALAAGGFHGDTGNKDLSIADDSGATKGKVKSLSLVGVHNCCGKCTRGIEEAVKRVDGVTGDTAKAKTDTIEVIGDFDALEVVKSLNAAGFHVKVKK